MADPTRSTIDPDLMKMLCCPETRQALCPADQATVDRLNHQITSGNLRNRGGQKLTEPIDGGAVRADGKFLYPIRHGIPVMLIDEAIALD